MKDQKVKEVIGSLQKWHANIVRQLEMAAKISKSIKIQGPSGDLITLTPEQSEGVKNGLLIALDVIGEFPVTIKDTNDEKE